MDLRRLFGEGFGGELRVNGNVGECVFRNGEDVDELPGVGEGATCQKDDDGLPCGRV